MLVSTKIQIKNFYEHKIVIFFLPINLNVCFGCSKEPSRADSSVEYPQHMFWIGNKENLVVFQYTLLSRGIWLNIVNFDNY